MAAAKSAGYEVEYLTFERIREYLYGDSWDASYWLLETKCGEIFASDKYDKNIAEGVDIMIQEILASKDGDEAE